MKKTLCLAVAMLLVAGLSVGVVAQETKKEEPKKEVKSEKKMAKAEKKGAKAEKNAEKKEEVKK